MGSFHQLKLNFNAGELSPFLVSRTDIAKYESGCQVLENFIILPYGGVIRRPGTTYMGAAKFADKPCRLIGFNFSTTTNFILEFGEKYLRFWTNGIQVMEPLLYAAWSTGILYQVNDRVNQANVNYRCLINHTSGTFATDLTANKWEKEDSVVSPPAWVTAKNYVANNRVKNAGSIYQCLIAHKSGVFATDLAAFKWRLLPKETGAPLWITASPYAVNNYVSRPATGNPPVQPTYKCLIAHTSGTFATDLAAGKWVAATPPALPPPIVHEQITPYLADDLREIQYTQINDIMYLVHPNHMPQKLKRLADDSWTFVEVVYKWPPVLNENFENIKITASAKSGNITLTASGALFEANDVGSTWQIGQAMAGVSETWTEVALVAASADSSPIRVRGPWSLITYGTWKGEVRVIRTITRTGVQETIRTYNASADGQRNISTTGTEDEDCTMFIRFIGAGSAGSSTPIARLEFSNAKIYGLVKITAFTDTTHVNGTVTWGLADVTATPYWSKPAFSKVQGYPRTVCLHDQRLIYGGTLKKPLSFHGSQIDDYDNFQRGVAADAAFLFNISANESNPIQWMVSQTKLLIGTAGDEWAVGSAKEDEALGAGNVQATQQSSFGSSFLQARVVNEVVLFAQRQGKKLRELTYSFEKDGWVAPDLCILASHVAGKGFAEMAFCQQPDAILWAITLEGRLVGMTYERDQNVVGWHRHSTDGTFESVGTIYGGNEADEVWFCVKRTIDGEDVRYIERFDTDFRVNFEREDKTNYIYLDCATRAVSATDEDMVLGLDFLEGKTVGILGDGANQPERVVSDGSISLQESVKVALVGLPYKSIVRPMNLNIPNQDTMQGRSVRIHQLVLRLHKSLTCKFSSDNGASWDEVYFRDRVDLMDASPAVFTGDKEVSTGAGFSTQQAMSVMQDRPFPLCILAEILWVNYYGH